MVHLCTPRLAGAAKQVLVCQRYWVPSRLISNHVLLAQGRLTKSPFWVTVTLTMKLLPEAVGSRIAVT